MTDKGQDRRVLVEGEARTMHRFWQAGHVLNKLVHFEGATDLIGTFVQVRLQMH